MDNNDHKKPGKVLLNLYFGAQYCCTCNSSNTSYYITIKKIKIMIVGSIKEDLTLEKRVSLTPETAKNIIGLGLKVCIEKNYAEHIGIRR